MQVILTEDVVGLGDIGENVSVKPGYARNYLIPRGFAIESTTSRARVVAHKMRQINAKKKKLKVFAEEQAEQIGAVSLEFGLRVGRGGKVFGSIGSRDIAEHLAKEGFEIDRRRVVLSEPIKTTGTHFVNVKLHPEVQVQIKLNIKKRAATKAEERLEAEEAREKIEAKAEKTEEQPTEEGTEESSKGEVVENAETE